MSEDGWPPRQTARVVGQGTTRRCALLLLVLVLASVGLGYQAGVTHTSADYWADFLATTDVYQRGLTAEEIEFMDGHTARAVRSDHLDAALPPALLAGGVLLLVAAGLFVAAPWWRCRRRRFQPLPPNSGLDEELSALARRAGVARVPRFGVHPLRLAPTAVTFGAAGRYTVRLNAGLLASRGRDPASFEAVVLHELAHIRNRDVEIAEAARALWWAFAGVIVVPYLVVLVPLIDTERAYWPGDRPEAPQTILWPLFLLLLTYLSQREILRSRERCADLDAVAWGADPSCWERLAGRRGRRSVTWLGSSHPSWRRRVATLEEPPLLTGGYTTPSQVVVLLATCVVLAELVFNTLPRPTVWSGPVPAVLCYSALALAVSLGFLNSRHPNAEFRAQPRPFGAEASRRATRLVVWTLCVNGLIFLDPLGWWLRPW